jgi:hypothetical protein
MHPKRLDCLEMLAQVAQESYGLFKEQPKEVDEKVLMIKTQADWNKELKE